ncbi:T9SS type A sorting domain-containing protein [Spirosoma areae]
MNYWNLTKLLCTVGLLSANPGAAQKATVGTQPSPVDYPRTFSAPASKINYYKADYNALTSVPPPAGFLKKRSPNGRLAAPTAQFIVSYKNFTPEAQRAFQYAVDIWSTLLVSSVPIRIQANWISQKPNLLGSAGPASYQYGFDGAQKAYAFYPIALAEKIARRQLNNPADADIVADFNRNTDWYYGTDGKPPKGQTDLVTSVLHELAHGLGFIGFFSVEDGKGDQGNGQYLASLPSIYDHFIENGQRQRLVTSQKDFPNNSIPLNRQLTGGDLYLTGPVLKQTTGQKLKIHAKAQFDKSTSIYHLNEDTYPPGDINSLMTAQLGLAEAIHTPGPLVLQFLSDLEWKTTSVLHNPPVNTEEAKDFVFSVRVISDTTLTANSVRLFYRKKLPTATDSTATAINLARVGSTDEYQFTLPLAQAQGDIWYYFQAQDASGRQFTNPGKLATGAQTWRHVQVGPDNSPPAILYSPAKRTIFSTTAADSLPIYARIADDRSGIASARVEYQINGMTQPALTLQYSRLTVNNTTYDSVYVNRINFPANSLKAGDKISYRIVARDSSRAKNQTVSPATGFYELTVVQPQAVRNYYENTFSSATTASDFVGNGFSFTTTTGFSDLAIHSEHPYRNGSDFLFQSNYEYVLLAPIRINANPDSAVMRFDEIVLVEPGDAGSRLGDATFYDYVIVEGSGDNGRTWKPLLDAYTANDKPEWSTAYSSDLVAGQFNERNSKANGYPAMYRRKEIRFLKPGSPFRAGDQILIRFRLFADQLAYGWGWAIDNLQIQLPPPAPVLGTEPVGIGTFVVYPNPVNTGLVRMKAELTKPLSTVYLTVAGATGQVLRQLTLKNTGMKVDEQLDLSQLPAGLYFLRLNADDSVQTQKVIITK